MTRRAWVLLDQHRLFDMLVLVGATWGLLQFHDSSPTDPLDTVILATVATAYALSALVMVLGTATWTVRALGLFLTACGNALLYGSAIVARLSHDRISEPVNDLTRAFLVIGGPLVLTAVIIWLKYEWLPGPLARRVTPPAPPPDPPVC